MIKNIFLEAWDVTRAGAVTILMTLFGIQMLRLLFASLVGYLRDARGNSALDLAPIALGLFSLAFLATLPRRILNLRRSLLFITAGVVLVRLFEQFSYSPWLDLILSAGGVVLFLFYLPLALGIARVHGQTGGVKFGVALLLGFSLDVVIMTASNTLDLTWQSGFMPMLIVALFSLALLLALRHEITRLDFDAPLDGTWKANLPLVTFGPWLLLQMLLYQNVAAISAHTGLETPFAGGFVVLCNCLALLFYAWAERFRSGLFTRVLLAGLLLVLTLAFIDQSGSMAALLILTGTVFSSYLIITILSAACSEKGDPGLLRTTISFAVAQILFVLFTFIYYLTYDIALGFRSSLLYPVMGTVLALSTLFASQRQRGLAEVRLGYYPAVAALILILVPIISALSWHQPTMIELDASTRQLRVMNYNLHNGFNRAGRLDMEALAQNIESNGVEVVALQEVSRGWLIWGGMDMLAWLSQRLEMDYISGPTADAQWGNAILTRYPIISSTLFPLPTDDLLLRRGYILAQLDIGSQTISLIATHFHHVDEGSEIRLIEAQTLLEGLPPNSPSLLLGDLNAIPTSDEMLLLVGAGLLDAAAHYGSPPTFTYPSDQPDKQIDYIWLTPDWAGSDFKIIQSTASDHLPIVVTAILSH